MYAVTVCASSIHQQTTPRRHSDHFVRQARALRRVVCLSTACVAGDIKCPQRQQVLIRQPSARTPLEIGGDSSREKDRQVLSICRNIDEPTGPADPFPFPHPLNLRPRSQSPAHRPNALPLETRRYLSLVPATTALLPLPSRGVPVGIRSSTPLLIKLFFPFTLLGPSRSYFLPYSVLEAYPARRNYRLAGLGSTPPI